MKLLCRLIRLLNHLSIVFALCFLTFAVLDWYNPMMGFTTNALSKKLLAAFCVTAILSAIGNLTLMWQTAGS